MPYEVQTKVEVSEEAIEEVWSLASTHTLSGWAKMWTLDNLNYHYVVITPLIGERVILTAEMLAVGIVNSAPIWGETVSTFLDNLDEYRADAAVQVAIYNRVRFLRF